jgi:hypothetical protein
MTTVAQSINLNITSTAALRAWVAAMSAAFSSIGLVKTGDTGQIDATTISYTGGSNSNNGYEIWRMNDSLQATKPVFIKVEYGSGSSYIGANCPIMWFTAGTATDGAGNITGLLTTRRALYAGFITSTVQPSIWAGDGTYAMMLLGYANGGSGSNSAPQIFFVIDRTRNADGTINGDGLVMWRTSYGGDVGYTQGYFNASRADAQFGSTSSQPTTVWCENYLIFDRQVAYERTRYSVALAPGHDWGNAVDGADITVFPMLVQAGKQTFVHAMLVGFNADFTQAVPISTTVLGSAHTYIPIKFTPTGLTNHCALLRWE